MALAGFGVGCLVGAAVAIMVRRRAAASCARDIMDKGRDLIGRGKEEMANLGVGMGNKIADALRRTEISGDEDRRRARHRAAVFVS